MSFHAYFPETVRVGGGDTFLTPDEHRELITAADAKLLGLTLYPPFQAAVASADPEALLSVHAVYPDEHDAASELKREGAEAVNERNFIEKDGDDLAGHKDRKKIHFLVTDNRFENTVPAGALEVQCKEPGRPLHAIAAIEGEPWNKNARATIDATREPDGSPLPDLLDDTVAEKVWDISLVSILPAYRGGGEYSITGYSVLNVLYNATLRAALAEGVDRLVAVMDVKVFEHLEKFLHYWHVLEGIEPLPYETRVEHSNKSVIATVNLNKWREAMATRRPAAHKMLWGHELENRGVEYVGLRSPNLYDSTPPNPRFEVAALNAMPGPTPFLVIDQGAIAARYQHLSGVFAGWNIHYAVKANPDQPILDMLHHLGSRFEVASRQELEQLERIGVDPATVLFSHPVKRRDDIAYAYQAGLDRFAFNSLAELNKIAEAAPGSRVYVRLATGGGDSAVPSEGKFGVGAEQAAALLTAAGDLGLQAYGVTFHVGSQMEKPQAWRRPLERCRELMERLGERGIRLNMLNVGGGLPGFHREGLPPFEDYAATINHGVQKLPYHLRDKIIEPGRAVVTDAGMLVATVLDIIDGDVHTDLGGFVLLEALQTGYRMRYPITDSRRSTRTMKARIRAATCDSADLIVEGQTLSADLQPGDRIYIGSAGAYSTVYASDFNGLAKPYITHIWDS